MHRPYAPKLGLGTVLARALWLAPVLALSACSGGARDAETALRDGYSALARGDGAAALPLLEQAAGELAKDASDPRWKEIQLALVEARGYVDPAAAESSFLSTVRAHPTRFQADDFATVGNRLAQAGAPLEAIDVVDAGLKEFGYGQHPRLAKVIDDIERRAAESGDTATRDKLKSLGYFGGTEDESAPAAPTEEPPPAAPPPSG